MKNAAISLILLAFLALLSLGATGSLVTGTSGVFNKVQGEVFQETSSEVILEDNKLFISINQKEKENSEKVVIDCLNFLEFLLISLLNLVFFGYLSQISFNTLSP